MIVYVVLLSWVYFYHHVESLQTFRLAELVHEALFRVIVEAHFMWIQELRFFLDFDQNVLFDRVGHQLRLVRFHVHNEALANVTIIFQNNAISSFQCRSRVVFHFDRFHREQLFIAFIITQNSLCADFIIRHRDQPSLMLLDAHFFFQLENLQFSSVHRFFRRYLGCFSTLFPGFGRSAAAAHRLPRFSVNGLFLCFGRGTSS